MGVLRLGISPAVSHLPQAGAPLGPVSAPLTPQLLLGTPAMAGVWRGRTGWQRGWAACWRSGGWLSHRLLYGFLEGHPYGSFLCPRWAWIPSACPSTWCVFFCRLLAATPQRALPVSLPGPMPVLAACVCVTGPGTGKQGGLPRLLRGLEDPAFLLGGSLFSPVCGTHRLCGPSG